MTRSQESPRIDSGAPDLTHLSMDFLWRCVRNDVEANASGHFRSTGLMDVNAAIRLYKASYWIRQVDALEQDFPRLFQVLGRNAFNEMCRLYLKKFPSVHPELEHLGKRLPNFLRYGTTTSLAAHADLAAYEWAVNECGLAADPHCRASLQDIDPERFDQTRFSFVPGLCVLQTKDNIWQQGEGMVPMPSASVSVEGTCDKVWIALARAESLVHRYKLTTLEALLLQAAIAGASVDDLAAIVREETAEDNLLLTTQILRTWFVRGWITNLHV